ncbi:hypothetical protein [Comamonas testosteroni]|uniref:hypothetical protein n=1 Tax=Comamonas testosteroni TaxID=285 RepID=UPI002E10105A|nr:hypothetical protein U0024_09050 [Comamonas testosteroni]
MTSQIFPAAPTDSLYKFMALTGLLLAVFCFFYPVQIANELKVTVIELDASVKKLKLSSAHASTVIELYNAKRETTRLTAEELVKLNEMVLTQNSAVEDKNALLEKQTLLIESYKEIKKYGDVGFWLGFLLSIFGFYFWYTRVQRHVDRELRNK